MTTYTRRIGLLGTVALLPLGVLTATGADAAAPASTGATVNVSTSAELTSALATVKAGETIQLAGGVTYPGAFDATTSGTSSAPITLTGAGSGAVRAMPSGCPARAFGWWDGVHGRVTAAEQFTDP